jgi:signal transduction histidine kinase
MAEALWVNANAKFRLGRLEEAKADLLQLDRITRVGSRANRIRPYVHLLRGAMDRSNEDLGSALQFYRQAQQSFIALGDDRGHGLALQSLGELYAAVGDSENAVNYLRMAQEAYAGDPAYLLSLFNNQGVAHQNGERHAAALESFLEALAAAQRVGAPSMITRIRLNITMSALWSGQLNLARATLRDIGPASNYASPSQRSDILGFQAFLALKEGRSGDARRLIGQALSGVDNSTSSSSYGKLHVIAHEIYSTLGDNRRALEQLEAVRRLDISDAQITASNRAAVIAAQFQFAAQDARIARLKAQQRQQETEYQRNVALVSVFGSLIALSLLFALLVLAIRSRNRARRDGAELAVANGHLQQALAAKAEFLASTSHELRTPLNGILGMTQIMLADPGLPNKLRGQVDLVHDAGTTMRALVDDILDVAKIEHGGFAITPRPTDMPALAMRVIRLFEAQSLERGVVLRLDAEAMPHVWLSVDPDRMTQILFNLVGNALKFTHEGHVTVELEPVDDGEGRRLLLSVVDQGVGIAPEWHEAIFDMFRQVDGTRTRQYGGTGLGLAICRQLARAMGGDISVVSAVGEGSRFTVSLPWQEVDGEVERLFAPHLPSGPVGEMVRNEDIAVIAPDPLRAALLAAMVRHAGRTAVIVDVPQQIAMVAADAQSLCLVDARGLTRLVDVCTQAGIAPAARLMVAGESDGDVPEMVAELATEVEFARNAVAAAIHAAFEARETGDQRNSCLHQDLASPNAVAGANQNKRQARAMGGT